MSPISGDVVFSLILNNNTPVILNKRHCTLIENDHLGDWSPVKDCCWRLTFRQVVRKPSSESSDRF